jgi:hypothetical protein
MNPDGRKGKVFSVRLEDGERELIQRACKAEEARRTREGRRDDEPWQGFYAPVGVGTFLRAAAVEKAKRLLAPGTTAAAAKPKRAKRGRR